MKPESLVIVDQHATVNMYLSLVLPARHTLEVEYIGSIFVIQFSFLSSELEYQEDSIEESPIM